MHPLCCYGVFGVITELMYLAITVDRQLFAKLHVVIFVTQTRINCVQMSQCLKCCHWNDIR